MAGVEKRKDVFYDGSSNEGKNMSKGILKSAFKDSAAFSSNLRILENKLKSAAIDKGKE